MEKSKNYEIIHSQFFYLFKKIFFVQKRKVNLMQKNFTMNCIQGDWL